jgi:uracil-DNA glycosylase
LLSRKKQLSYQDDDSQESDMTTSLTWHDVLAAEKQKPYFIDTLSTVAAERAAGVTVYPPQKDVFNAFRFTELADVKVVILGQDPYHGPGQAHGLAFSVLPGVAVPPSLVNIYKELQSNFADFVRPDHGYLESWARQGVMLLNTVLTVEAGKAHSHARLGWETFTDKVIELINQHCEGVVFLLWGSHSQKKGSIIDRKRHYVLQAPHPSPLSAHRGFLGCRHFAKTNEYLIERGLTPIDWTPRLPQQ